MMVLNLVRLIERHSEELAQGLTKRIRDSERTYDFRNIPPERLQLAAVEVYRNLGVWLLQKTEVDIEKQFRDIATRRVADGIGLHQFVWALIVSRDHLWQFLQQETFADNIVELFGKLELQQMLNQFFDRAVYYGILGYAAARGQDYVMKDSVQVRRPLSRI